LGSEVVEMVQEYYCQEQIPEVLITNEAKQDSVEAKLSGSGDEKPR